MTSSRRLDITTLTRLVIGGQGPLRSTQERLAAGALVTLSGILALAAILVALSGGFSFVGWVIETSTARIAGLAGFAMLFGQLCAIAFGVVALLFGVRTVAKRSALGE